MIHLLALALAAWEPAPRAAVERAPTPPEPPEPAPPWREPPAPRLGPDDLARLQRAAERRKRLLDLNKGGAS